MSPGIGLAPGRAAQQQRELAVGLGLLGQVVVHDQGVPPAVAEVLGHGAAGVGGQELHGRGVGGGGGHDGGVLHRPVLLQGLVDLDHGGALLADGHVEAVHVLAALVDDGVDGQGGLAGLAVADDQFALSAADRGQGVDDLDAGLQRLLHVLALDDAGRLDLDRPGLRGLRWGRCRRWRCPRASTMRPISASPTGHRGDGLGALDLVAFLDLGVVAEDGHADVVFLEVQGHARDRRRRTRPVRRP